MREREEANLECESSFDAVQTQSFDVHHDLILVCIQTLVNLVQGRAKLGNELFCSYPTAAFIVLAQNNASYQIGSIIPSVGRR